MSERLPPLAVHAWARATDADVEARHLAVFGRGFRRIGSYVKLAQVGAQACLAAAAPDAVPEHARVGVFMGSGLGNTEIAVPLAEGILHAEKPWCSPMAFAGSVGNAAAFYVARSIAQEGMNVTVSQEELSFEAALLEAVIQLRLGNVDRALVGGVDVHEHARPTEHRARLDAEGVPGEPAAGTGWLLLGPDAAGARATLDEVHIGRLGGDAREGVPAGAWVLPGWRLQDLRGPDVAPVETRLMAVAAALRIVEVLDGTEALPAGRTRVAHLHRTRAGTGARVVLTLRGA